MKTIITTHKATDFDAFASVVAGTLLYPDAVPVLPKAINPNVKAFLSIHKDLFEMHTAADINCDEVKTLIVTDTNHWNRLDGLSELQQRDDLEIIVWDHHTGGNITATWKCQEKTGATITLLIHRLKKDKIALTPMHATLFLAGLYEDTGGLTFPSTTPRDAYAAAFLLEQKADLRILNSFLRPAYGQKHKNILSEMLKSASRLKIRGFTISINQTSISGHVSNLAVVVHMYREILNLDVAFGIFIDHQQDKCIIIGRSSIEDINIAKIMHTLGGGGHIAAGSAVIKSGNPDEIEKRIITMIRGNQISSVLVGDLMSFPVFSVSPDILMEDVAQLLRKKGCTGVPVVENDEMVGIISRRDFKRLKKNKQIKSPVKAFMNRACITITPDQSPVDAARLMVKHDIGRLPVVQDGKVIGIITRSDTMRYFYDLLPD